MIAGMLYANVLCRTTRKHIISKSYPKGVDELGQPVMVSARVDLEFMKAAIDELKTFEKKARPKKMDVSSVNVPEVFSHEEWVSWMEWQG